MTAKNPPPPPQISPFLFPILLFGFGLWCLYDGWFSTDPKMQEHLTFNRTFSGIFICWSIADFIRTYKKEKEWQAQQRQKRTAQDANESEES